MFGNKNKIKKRTFQPADGKNVVLAKKNRGRSGAGRFFGKILNFLLLLVFLGVTAYVLFFSAFLKVSNVAVTGAQAIDPALIREATTALLSGKYLNLIEKNNIIFADPEKTANMLRDKFKRIETVQVEKKFPETLVIRITERKSMLILCSQGQCYIVDGNGVAYARADFASADLQENELLVLNDDGGREIKLSEKVLEPEYIRYLSDIKDGLKNDLGLEIDKNYHTPQLVSGDIRVVTSEGWGIYFSDDVPISKELEMLKIVLEEKIEKNKRSELEYVDLRIDNKIFYKLRPAE